ncbi:hypothetical protein HKBW3S03_00753 [Candidatus Hakubella thermalkaliphila]|uniref:Uncharacterized protein n=1 Tax=Candidatus Hakubella thermalkaliphila TaxID=2754717 RepID=A0A6V8NG79_9ACTN|nr:hypothetical protein [Candidatus Hakubella thermalkaliphila]GFP19248.1 hypothetical protein HKBW3S03_00753 [Candidatus Hakubella thermalkaliphila]GFP29990.1 hypothetical protein HKBW3S34_00910 [Candidatus Hakubella thermalkaliphila]GFP41350.1 hypothetical protein HKBW3C_00476 [Candidatus Hakubella thermalkaliphila]
MALDKVVAKEQLTDLVRRTVGACNKIKLTFCTGHAKKKAWRKG